MSLVIGNDLRAALGPVRDQGRRATCLAFAASAVHAHLQGYDAQLCVEWLFYHAVTRAGDDPADGSTIEDNRSVTSKPSTNGCPTSSVCRIAGAPVRGL